MTILVLLVALVASGSARIAGETPTVTVTETKGTISITIASPDVSPLS